MHNGTPATDSLARSRDDCNFVFQAFAHGRLLLLISDQEIEHFVCVLSARLQKISLDYNEAEERRHDNPSEFIG